jgi:hypothetical protein
MRVMMAELARLAKGSQWLAHCLTRSMERAAGRIASMFRREHTKAPEKVADKGVLDRAALHEQTQAASGKPRNGYGTAEMSGEANAEGRAFSSGLLPQRQDGGRKHGKTRHHQRMFAPARPDACRRGWRALLAPTLGHCRISLVLFLGGFERASVMPCLHARLLAYVRHVEPRSVQVPRSSPCPDSAAETGGPPHFK